MIPNILLEVTKFKDSPNNLLKTGLGSLKTRKIRSKVVTYSVVNFLSNHAHPGGSGVARILVQSLKDRFGIRLKAFIIHFPLLPLY